MSEQRIMNDEINAPRESAAAAPTPKTHQHQPRHLAAVASAPPRTGSHTPRHAR